MRFSTSIANSSIVSVPSRASCGSMSISAPGVGGYAMFGELHLCVVDGRCRSVRPSRRAVPTEWHARAAACHRSLHGCLRQLFHGGYEIVCRAVCTAVGKHYLGLEPLDMTFGRLVVEGVWLREIVVSRPVLCDM